MLLAAALRLGAVLWVLQSMVRLSCLHVGLRAPSLEPDCQVTLPHDAPAPSVVRCLRLIMPRATFVNSCRVAVPGMTRHMLAHASQNPNIQSSNPPAGAHPLDRTLS